MSIYVYKPGVCKAFDSIREVIRYLHAGQFHRRKDFEWPERGDAHRVFTFSNPDYVFADVFIHG